MSELPGGSLSGAAERIRQILVTAEALSQDIHREASEEAERYLAARRQEADALVEARRERLEQALATLRTEGREIERRMAELTAALERALEDSAPAPPPVAAAQPPAAEPEAPAAQAEAAPAAVADNAEQQTPASDGDSSRDRQRALIRATQLAVQGADRTTVRETLQREFELEDPAAIVEEILGSD